MMGGFEHEVCNVILGVDLMIEWRNTMAKVVGPINENVGDTSDPAAFDMDGKL